MGSITIHPQGQSLITGADSGDLFETYALSEDPDFPDLWVYSDAVAADTVVDEDVTYLAPDGPVRVQLTNAAGTVTVFDEVVHIRGGSGAVHIWPQPTVVQLAALVNVAAPEA